MENINLNSTAEAEYNWTANEWNVTSSPSDMADGSGEEHSAVGRILTAFFLVVIILCSVTGNSLVCVAVLTQRALRKSSNFFYVSLACSDLLVALAVMTFSCINDVKGRWIFGKVFCNIWMSLDVMCCTASILNICAISFDRYMHIRKPYAYSDIMTPRRTLLLILGVWLVSALISFIPIHLGLHRQADTEPYDADGNFICLIDFNPVYAVGSSLVSFFIPCLIMLFMYISMYRLAQRHVKSIKQQKQATASLGVPQPKSSSDNKASRTLGVIMGVFLVCWTPFFTVNVVTTIYELPEILFIVATWLGYINSMANPIIYTIFNKQFRAAFKKLLFLEKCCRGRNSGAPRNGNALNAQYAPVRRGNSEERRPGQKSAV